MGGIFENPVVDTGAENNSLVYASLRKIHRIQKNQEEVRIF
jgi:hypothetical protein